jgi:hypothetical protein
MAIVIADRFLQQRKRKQLQHMQMCCKIWHCEGGLAGSHNRLIYNTTLKTDRMEFHSEANVRCMGTSHTLALFLDMERLLSDQALKQGHLGDALAHTGDEGRSTLR